MGPKLIGEEGLLSGLTLSLEAKDTWILGRDVDQSDIVLEDPSVSRKHCQITKERNDYFVENLSLINPLLLNRAPIKEKTKISEGSTLQIGSTLFRFTFSLEQHSSYDGEDGPTLFEEKSATPTIVDLNFPQSRFLLKVLSGPNSGAEFYMQVGKTYILGKDATLSDIVFHDRSVSAEHASLLIAEDAKMEIRDLGSKNGVFVSNIAIDEKHEVHPNEIVQMGTTSFVIIDTKTQSATIISPKPESTTQKSSEPKVEEKVAKVEEKKPLSRLFFPTQDLIIASFFGLIVLLVGISGIMLFKKQTPTEHIFDYHGKIHHALGDFKSVEYTFNEQNGALLLVGNVSTSIDLDQIMFQLKKLDFVKKISNKIAIDELIWQEMNALIAKNPNWVSINMHSPMPGLFVVTGYVPTTEDWQKLQDYLNTNFVYLDKLENHVIIEQVLEQEVNKLIQEQGFANIATKYQDGDITLSGSIAEKSKSKFESMITSMRRIDGVRHINNVVIYQKMASEAVNITQEYQVTGTTEREGEYRFAVINGKVYSIGALVNGMTIEKISGNEILLEKDGLKYRIEYTL